MSPALGGAFLFIRVICLDDAPHKRVTHDIGAVQVNERDLFKITQNVLDMRKAIGTPDKVALRGVSRNNECRIETQASQEHLHLLGRSILRLIQDNESVVERTPTHIRQRGDLDNASLHQLGCALGIHHIEQCIKERTHIRINLVFKRARQKAKVLAGFDNWSG